MNAKRLFMILGGVGILWFWYKQSSQNASVSSKPDGAIATSLSDVAKFIGDIKPAGTLDDLTQQFQEFLGISGKADSALGDPGLKTVYVKAQSPFAAKYCNTLGSNKPCNFEEP